MSARRRWLVAGTVRVAPRYLEYFDEAAGGAPNGRRWLIDSKLDAGQDLVRLERYAAARGGSTITLAYMGPVHPGVYGIRFAPLTQESRGPAVISASTLMGSPAEIWSDEARRVSPTFDTFSWLRDKEPAGQIGSMLLFDLR